MDNQSGPSRPNRRGTKNKKNAEIVVDIENPGTDDTVHPTPGDPPLTEQTTTQKSDHDSDADEGDDEEEEKEETVTVEALVKKYTGKIRKRVKNTNKHNWKLMRIY